MKKGSKTEWVEYRGIHASNIIYASLHAPSTVGLKVGGTICLDNCTAEGKNCLNIDFGRKHASIVTGRKWKNEKVDNPIGVFHLLPEELQRNTVITSKDNANINKRRFDDALEISL